MLDRQRYLNQQSRKEGPVVCWISRDLRAEDHWGLILAQQEAISRQQPLIVVFCLQSEFLGAMPSAFSFMLAGLAETSADLSALSIPLVILTGSPPDILPKFCHQISAGILFCDFSPLRLAREWRNQLVHKMPIQIIEIDAHNVIPCWLASDHQEYGAYTFRPKVSRHLDHWLVDFPKLQQHPFSVDVQLTEQIKLDPMLVPHQLSHLQTRYPAWSGKPTPGNHAGRAALKFFIRDCLPRYDRRNDPNANASSGLSPWLHFGQLAPQRVALDVKNISKENAGSEQPLVELQANFLEELIIRRELSDNFCYYNPDYDQFSSFPNWAQTTLLQHRADHRPYIYSLQQLESAETADPLWNAAQRYMIESGYMSGYLRMYWAKKILEWSPDPETAQANAIVLNDRYFLDGRDPNGYTGIAWAIGGVHDRAWNERPVFGKIRTMTYEGCRRKFDVDQYIAAVAAVT